MTVWEEVPERVEEVARKLDEVLAGLDSFKVTSTSRLDNLETGLRELKNRIDLAKEHQDIATGAHARTIGQLQSDVAKMRGEVDIEAVKRFVNDSVQRALDATVEAERRMAELVRTSRAESEKALWDEVNRLNGVITVKNA